MSVVVFAGPTVPVAAIRSRIDARVEPPAAVGDVLRAARGGARAIALIDGVFDRVLPVWHKEILWAMAQGIHVFGAASMGALRAAELHAFGMRGVGRIFAAYRDGVLEADDEVAVLHGPAEVGFAVVTEALVNVRATLDRAEAERLIDQDERAAVLGLARSLHYRERTWDAVLASAAMALPNAAERLAQWLPTGRVDLKRDDATDLLDELAAFMRTDPAPMRADFRFAWTDAWEALHARSAHGATASAVLDELRLQVDRLRAIRRAALLRVLAGRQAGRRGAASGGPPEERLRARLGLWRGADLDRWLAAHDLDRPGFTGLADEEALLDGLERDTGAELQHAMLAELRASGGYAALAERARRKSARLAAAGLDGLSAGDAGVDLAPMLGSLAAHVDGAPAELARHLGFVDQPALEQAVLREHLFIGIIRADSAGVTNAPATARPDSR